MTFQIFGTTHLQDRNPEQDVIDRIDELVNWQMADSAAAHREGVKREVEQIKQLPFWRLTFEICKYMLQLVRAHFGR